MGRSRRRVWGPIALAAGALATGLTAGSVALSTHFARRVLQPASAPDARVAVWATEGDAPDRVWIHGPDAALEGKYSFIFDTGRGHARLGPVVDRIVDDGVERVAREVLAVDRGELRVGVKGRITGWWFTGPEELGFSWETVSFPVDGGIGRAWLIAPEQSQPGHWAVHVHGRGALPEETLRGVPPLARAGATNLVISYRNDPGVPEGIRGRYGLGLAERHDVDAAIAYALSRGATRVTLVGWSMGGTAAVLSATRGPHRGVVDGLVLDSPGLDWPEILRHQASLVRLPAFLGALGVRLLELGLVRGAVPWQRGTGVSNLTPAGLARNLRAPVLIHAGPGDTFVPWGGSVRFAHLRPDLVRLREAPGEHVKLWNVHPEAWEFATQEFVTGLDSPPAGRLFPLGGDAEHRRDAPTA